MNISSLLKSWLAAWGAQKIAKKLGIDNPLALKLIALGAPVLLARMSKNAESEEWKTALYKALDKHQTAKNDIDDDDTDGQKILGHVFGDDDSDLDKVASEAWVSRDQAKGALASLAPLLMSGLGQEKASGNLDLGSLAGMLGGATKASSDNSLMTSLATSLLDKDGDGDIKDDMMNMWVNWLKKKFMS
jgi:hypothetical protein